MLTLPLVIIIVILLGFVGWYIYHTDHKTTDKASTTSSSAKTTGYFTITQWGVRAPYGGDLTLEYTAPNSTNQIYLSSDQLDQDNPSSCSMANISGGYITRYAPSDEWLDEGGTSSGQTVEQYLGTISSGTSPNELPYSHVGNYYYVYAGPQAPCDFSTAGIRDSGQTVAAFQSIAQKLQAVPTQ